MKWEKLVTANASTMQEAYQMIELIYKQFKEYKIPVLIEMIQELDGKISVSMCCDSEDLKQISRVLKGV